jgi:putative flippase GtrA
VRIAVQFMKYVTVALISAASDWIVFAGLFALFGRPIAAQATSRIVGGVVSFAINKYWSFESREHKRTLIEAWRFIVLFGASYILSLALFSFMTWVAVHPYVAKLLADSACFIFNFMVMRLWVYRRRRPGATARRLSLMIGDQ